MNVQWTLLLTKGETLCSATGPEPWKERLVGVVYHPPLSVAPHRAKGMLNALRSLPKGRCNQTITRSGSIERVVLGSSLNFTA